MSDEMSSKNSNNSDIEVIGPEDLEESPPPQDNNTEPGSEAAGDTAEAAPETKEVIKSRTKSDLSEDPHRRAEKKKRPFVRPANF